MVAHSRIVGHGGVAFRVADKYVRYRFCHLQILKTCVVIFYPSLNLWIIKLHIEQIDDRKRSAWRLLVLLSNIFIFLTLPRPAMAELTQAPPDIHKSAKLDEFPSHDAEDLLKRLAPDLKGGPAITQLPEKQWKYKSTKRNIEVYVSEQHCAKAACEQTFVDLVGKINKQIEHKDDARFTAFETYDEFSAAWTEKGLENRLIAFMSGDNVCAWRFVFKSTSSFNYEDSFEELRFIVSQQRYHNLDSSNLFAPQVGLALSKLESIKLLKYVSQLRARNRNEDALFVLRRIAIGAPFLYEAHAKILDMTPDPIEAKNSAQIIFTNAEDQKYIAKAENILGIKEYKINSFIVSEKQLSRPKLAIFPIEPFNIRLIKEAADIFSKTTGIENQIMAPPQDFQFGQPDRVPFEATAQAIIRRLENPDQDFMGWDADRYAERIDSIFKDKNPAARFDAQALSKRIRDIPQYDAENRTISLWNILGLRWISNKNMKLTYTIVTEANIGAKDRDFITNISSGSAGSTASIISYYYLEARNNGDAFESRQRLVERLAKELVVVGLKGFGIPRPNDPRDPYSVGSSIQRIDEKTLTLSEPTKDAMKQILSR